MCALHGVSETLKYPELRQILNAADLITTDGTPLVWLVRWSPIVPETSILRRSVDMMQQATLSIANFRLSIELSFDLAFANRQSKIANYECGNHWYSMKYTITPVTQT